MLRDEFGIDLSSARRAAADHFADGLRAALTLDRSGIAALEQALALDPEFALARCLLARQCMIYGRGAELQEQLRRAEQSLEDCGPQEQHAVRVGIAALRHEPDALDAARAHLEQYPRDIFVLMQLVGPFGLHAFSGLKDWRERNVATLDTVAPSYSDSDWWFAAALAFAFAETGSLGPAQEHGERAWALDANGTTGHALAHVHIEQSATAEGVALLDAWLDLLPSSDIRHHMTWHRALLQLAASGPDGLLDLFAADRPMQDNAPPLDVLSDNASLLWRLFLRGVDVPRALWEDVGALVDAHFAEPGFAFADLHSALAAAALGGERRSALLAALSTEGQATMRRCSEGLNAFADGDYARAATTLSAVLEDAVTIGGSNPQRGVLRETYAEAVRRSG